ncbi:hypothetical protein E4U61_005721 [Claviceps capensis]|nr:hypothetical protein E4U61_005721 [Claviceps capensis]
MNRVLVPARTGTLARWLNRLASAPSCRRLHLAPPFLLDDYMRPRSDHWQYGHLRKCNLCPRLCGVNRFETTGTCLIGDKVKVNVVAPHFGEEPCIQGHNGSGAVFMSGCNLRCVFCQNFDIAHQRYGMDLTPEELAEWHMKLQEVGQVHNINIVTPEHVVPQVALSIIHAKQLGLRLLIVYNTSSFDSLESLQLMEGLVDIYLDDFKVWKASTAKRLLKTDEYASVGDLYFTPDGLAKRGLLIRHLVMPGKGAEGAEIMKWLASEISPDCFVNIMEQYHPDAHVGKAKKTRAHHEKPLAKTLGCTEGEEDAATEQARYADLNRTVPERELSVVKQAAYASGLWRFNEPPKHDGFAI